jgi:hypothetical protein
MNTYNQLYNDLAKLPTMKLCQLLSEVLLIEEIKARMDGTVAVVRAYGLLRFPIQGKFKLTSGLKWGGTLPKLVCLPCLRKGALNMRSSKKEKQ